MMRLSITIGPAKSMSIAVTTIVGTIKFQKSACIRTLCHFYCKTAPSPVWIGLTQSTLASYQSDMAPQMGISGANAQGGATARMICCY